MKQSKKVVSQRRQRILNELSENSNLSADDLAAKLNVSALTIRRDFQFLEEHNRIQRHYGGAKVVENFLDYSNRNDLSENRKNLIAKKGAEFVQDGDTIFINTSSTALLVLKYLGEKKVNVITNNANAIHIKRQPNINIFLTGGELREPKYSMVGEFAYNNISKVSANKAFIGCSGISAKVGITTAALAEVAINELMLHQCTGKRFVLAESTKVGHNHSFVSSSLDQIDMLITDNDADKDEIERINNNNVETIIINEF